MATKRPARASPELREAPLSPRYHPELHHPMGHCLRAQSSAQEWVGNHFPRPNTIQTFSQAQRRFDTAEIDVLIHDRPILQYIVANRLMENVKLAPLELDPQHYGFAFPEGSALREPVSRALLTILDDEVWEATLHKHVGGY